MAYAEANYNRNFVDQLGNPLTCSVTGWVRFQSPSNDYYEYPNGQLASSYGNGIGGSGWALVSGNVNVTYNGDTKNLTWSVYSSGGTVTDYGDLVFTVNEPPPKAINPTPETNKNNINTMLNTLTWEYP